MFFAWFLTMVATGGGLCLLHGKIPRWGYGPFFLLVGSLEIAMYAEAERIVLAGPWHLPVSSVVLFPVILAGLFVVYMVDGTERARLLLGAFLAVRILYELGAGLIVMALQNGVVVGDRPGWNLAPRVAFASIGALLIDVFILLLLSQFLANHLPRLSKPAMFFVVLVSALIADAVAFPLFLHGPTADLGTLIGGHLVGKLLAAGFLTVPFGIYLQKVQFITSPRPVFDLFLPPYDLVSRQLRDQESSPRLPIESLYRSAAALGRDLDLDQTLDRVLREGIRILAVDHTWIFLADRASEELVARAGPKPDHPLQLRLPLAARSVAGRAFREKSVVVVPNARIHPDVVPELLERFQQKSMLAVPLLSRGESIGVLLFAEHGRYRSFDSSEISMAQALAGHAAIAISNAQHVDEILALNDALSAREMRLRLVTEQVPAVLWTTDKHLIVTSAVGSALAATGLVPSELPGRKVVDLVGSDDPDFPPLLQHIRALAGQSGRYEFVFASRAFETHMEPLRGERNEIIGTVGVALDVTSRREAEARLGESQAELSTYQDLLTHDLANFLTTLLGLIERLLHGADGPLTPDQEELLRRANRQTFELNRMAENARLLVKLRSQRLPVEAGRFVLSEVVGQIVETLRAVHFDREIDISVDVPAGLVISSVPMIENVILNLVDNGIRHSRGTGRASVRVKARSVDEPAAAIELAVSGGKPPAPEFLPQLFRRYARGAHSGGSGLALALVREIVERSGGSIEAGVVAGPDGDEFEVRLVLPKG